MCYLTKLRPVALLPVHRFDIHIPVSVDDVADRVVVVAGYTGRVSEQLQSF